MTRAVIYTIVSMIEVLVNLIASIVPYAVPKLRILPNRIALLRCWLKHLKV